MTNTVISVEHLTKQYDLGVIGTGTISRDLNRWWARVRKQPDPYTRIGQKDAFERFGESILALDDVSFTVQQGEALGIIGRNGAGKSTLLKILSRVTAPTSGVVKVKGRIGSLLEVGTGFHPELTGRENVYLNGAILGMKKEEVTRKFDEIVDFSGVEKFIDTPVKRYSSGMYVRLAFAVAAHLDPEILIVDEVLAVGDAEFQKKCLGKMGDVAHEGRTVLFVSHNMDAIQRLCSEALYVENGQLISKGASSSIVDEYLKETVNNFQNHEIMFDIKDGQNIIAFDKVTISQNIQEGIICKLSYFVFKEKVEGLIAIRIDTSRGLPVLTTTDCDLDQENFNKEKGHFSVNCNLPTHLLSPGNYRITISAADLKGARYDFHEGILEFNVKQSQKIKPTFKREGIMLIPIEWQVSKIIDKL